jgi:hypothetical protein
LVDAQTIGVLVTAASVTVAAIYYSLTLRTNQRNSKANLETRQAQLFMQLYTTFSSYEFKTKWHNIMDVLEWRDYEDFWAKFGYSTLRSSRSWML